MTKEQLLDLVREWVNAREAYDHAVDNYLDVADAESVLLDAEQALKYALEDNA